MQRFLWKQKVRMIQIREVFVRASLFLCTYYRYKIWRIIRVCKVIFNFILNINVRYELVTSGCRSVNIKNSRMCSCLKTIGRINVPWCRRGTLKDVEGMFKEFNKALLPSLCKEESCNVSFRKKSALIASTTRASTGATRLSTVLKNLFVPLVE